MYRKRLTYVHMYLVSINFEWLMWIAHLSKRKLGFTQLTVSFLFKQRFHIHSQKESLSLKAKHLIAACHAHSVAYNIMSIGHHVICSEIRLTIMVLQDLTSKFPPPLLTSLTYTVFFSVSSFFSRFRKLLFRSLSCISFQFLHHF